MDRFFTQKHCDRCGKELVSRIMSMYNEDCICLECKEEETQFEDYKIARDAEHEEVKRGNYNYEGIGLKKGRK